MKQLASHMNFDQQKYFDSLYQTYQVDPSGVEASWRSFFEGFSLGKDASSSLVNSSLLFDIFTQIEHLRQRGFTYAQISPLENAKNLITMDLPEVTLPSMGIFPEEEVSYEKLFRHLKEVYADRIGIEYAHICSEKIKGEIQRQIERKGWHVDFTLQKKRAVYREILMAEQWERSLQKKFPGKKRFSLEGCETLIPLLQEIFLQAATRYSMKESILGMSHRGRMNVLLSLLEKPYYEIEEEFCPSADLHCSVDDVAYHKGRSRTLLFEEKPFQVTLLPNPSHLEAIYPVISGFARARQWIEEDREREKILPVVVHGDGSFSSQGVVYEMLQSHRLTGYETGGTLHIIVNNDLSFTATKEEMRSVLHCSDLAKSFDIPILHLNAEDPESCLAVVEKVLNWRQNFHCDCVINLHGYRRMGHNESDNPQFTNPRMYSHIEKKQSIAKIYENQLRAEAICPPHFTDTIQREVIEEIRKKMQKKKVEEKGTHCDPSFSFSAPSLSSLSPEQFTSLMRKIHLLPSENHIHRKIAQWREKRLSILEEDIHTPLVDWSLSETLAFASLLQEGIPIRFSGQDSVRGTFSQRHGGWYNQKTGELYIPLQSIEKRRDLYQLWNSPLSEYAILGFEWGYSLPLSQFPSLTIWEAQFGDFCNGAQIIIDQFISSAKQKWNISSGLVLMLPHGYEGQGPEHSSARMERFCQLAACDNLRIAFPSTPVQLFYLLREQAHLKEKVPLILFTPKAMLRDSLCLSAPREFFYGNFQTVLYREGEATEQVLFCSGKIYYELLRRKCKKSIICLEQLYPFPKANIEKLLSSLPNGSLFTWIQEEPKNMGAWNYVRDQLSSLLPQESTLSYLGRRESASPATGNSLLHNKEQEEILLSACN